jgi:antitoxin (DNA-binding transcriptional repressor) of toxin-antitoxin stability system
MGILAQKGTIDLPVGRGHPTQPQATIRASQPRNHPSPENMTIATTELPEILQTLFLEVEQTNQSVTITHQGKPIVIITPANPPKPNRPAFGFMQGEILGDITAPIEQPWEVLQ